jgi:hypothetical protein
MTGMTELCMQYPKATLQRMEAELRDHSLDQQSFTGTGIHDGRISSRLLIRLTKPIAGQN